ncbi:MAG: radical SAM protein [Smithella sp.]|nr:radical SAM protein [Smithella sp.]
MNAERRAKIQKQTQNLFKYFSRFLQKPSLTKLYIEPTTQCNLQCRTCIRNSWDEPIGFMDMALYQKFLSEMKSFRSLERVAFWGFGEPLVHPDIVEMVSLVHQAGLQTEIITNGHLLDKNTAVALIQAGLDTIVVSVDGATQSSYEDIRLGGDLFRVEENIRELNGLRGNGKKPSLGLEFVMMKSNIHELPALAGKARLMKADFIMLTNLLPCSEDMKDEILYWMSATINDPEERPRWSSQLMLPRMDVRPEYMNPLLEFLKILDMDMPANKDIPAGYHCPFVQKSSAAISWSGEVSPCIALMHSYRSFILGREKRFERYSFGNVAQENFANIWHKKSFRQFRDRVLKFDFAPCVECSGCDLAETNQEDCLGNTHPVCGDCLWAKSVLLCP